MALSYTHTHTHIRKIDPCLVNSISTPTHLYPFSMGTIEVKSIHPPQVRLNESRDFHITQIFSLALNGKI